MTTISSSARSPKNPLLALTREQKSQAFLLLRNGEDLAEWLEREAGLQATRRQVDAFFKAQAREHWSDRIERAAQEAQALIELVRKNRSEFSEGVLAALGQEAFRQIASGKVEPGVLAQFAQLFNRVRADDRAERSFQLKVQKHRADLKSKMDSALEAFAKEVKQNARAREAFEALKRELNEGLDLMEAA